MLCPPGAISPPTATTPIDRLDGTFESFYRLPTATTGYHDAVQRPGRQEPPFDPRWLDLLAECCADAAVGRPQLSDLYLERRLEVRVARAVNGMFIEECRREGVAARWRRRGGVRLDAVSGVGARSLAAVLGRRVDRWALTTTRRVPAPDLDLPRGWRDWATRHAERLATPGSEVRYLERRAVVVGADGWHATGGPALVRAARGSGPAGALLAVWGHPRLDRWMQRLAEPPATRRWAPDPGTRWPIVLASGTSGVLLHEVVGHLLEGDLGSSGRSPMRGLEGSQAAAENLTVVDDPTRLDLPGGFEADDEGVPASPIALVEAGRIAGWLCDRGTADELRASPGRGRRAGWDLLPVPRLSNLVVRRGATPAADLESSQDRALLVTRLGGATVDPASRRVVLRVERGWEVRHGRRRRALAPFELTGDALEILAHLDPSFGDDATPDWRLGWCVKRGIALPTGSESPTIVAHRLEVL